MRVARSEAVVRTLRNSSTNNQLPQEPLRHGSYDLHSELGHFLSGHIYAYECNFKDRDYQKKRLKAMREFLTKLRSSKMSIPEIFIHTFSLISNYMSERRPKVKTWKDCKEEDESHEHITALIMILEKLHSTLAKLEDKRDLVSLAQITKALYDNYENQLTELRKKLIEFFNPKSLFSIRLFSQDPVAQQFAIIDALEETLFKAKASLDRVRSQKERDGNLTEAEQSELRTAEESKHSIITAIEGISLRAKPDKKDSCPKYRTQLSRLEKVVNDLDATVSVAPAHDFS